MHGTRSVSEIELRLQGRHFLAWLHLVGAGRNEKLSKHDRKKEEDDEERSNIKIRNKY